jgi:hypothetical protein
LIRKTIKSLSEAGSTALDLIAGRYPPFVYGGFHGVELESLDAMLAFLSDNGYDALNADECVDALNGRLAPPRKAVVLTFDDGWGSLWSVGFSLLKKYRMKVVVFIPPGRIEHGIERNPTIDDLELGKYAPEQVFGRDDSTTPLLTWEEINEMHSSGLVDFQSHSFNHGLIPWSTKIVDFLTPQLTKRAGLLELPCPADMAAIGNNAPVRFGEPLFETAPRLSDIPRLRLDPRIAEGCAKFVEDYGADRFFERQYWRQELEHLANVLVSESEITTRETPEEQAEAIRFELTASKETIESMLPGKSVHHICYPWHIAGSIAERESRKAGYISAFWGKIDGRYFNYIPGNPFRIARVGGDFFYRLPGRGRAGLFKILMKKIVRRAHSGSPYLSH